MAWHDFLSRKAQPAPGQQFFIINADAQVSRTLGGFFKEGYSGNPIVYSCISVIAKNAASVKLEVQQAASDKVLTDHPLLALLRRPNPTQNGKEFFKELVTLHQAAGEAFVLRLPENGKPAELYNLDPRHIDVEKPKDGGAVPTAYIYGSGENKKRYAVDQLTGACQVLHIKGPNLLDDFRGMSPLAAAAVAADTHNAGGKWNFGLLKNSARPSGVLEATGNVSESTLQQLRTYFKRTWTGADNAGNMPMLTGGVKFTAMSIDPVDMDFATSMTEAAKNIALVYGVPLPLVTTEAATFSNMDAALERLWTDTVLPLLDEVIEALSDFLAPFFGKGLVLQYNADSVPALEAKRTRKFERMVKAVDSGLLTPNEARVEIGFDKAREPVADKLFMKQVMRPIDKLDVSPSGGAAANDNQPPAADDTALAKAMKGAGYTAEETAAALTKEFAVG